MNGHPGRGAAQRARRGRVRRGAAARPPPAAAAEAAAAAGTGPRGDPRATAAATGAAAGELPPPGLDAAAGNAAPAAEEAAGRTASRLAALARALGAAADSPRASAQLLQELQLRVAARLAAGGPPLGVQARQPLAGGQQLDAAEPDGQVRTLQAMWERLQALQQGASSPAAAGPAELPAQQPSDGEGTLSSGAPGEGEGEGDGADAGADGGGADAGGAAGRRSAYRGLTWDRKDGRWRVRIHYQGKQHHIGRRARVRASGAPGGARERRARAFTDEVIAAQHFDAAALLLFGGRAVTNFGLAAAAASGAVMPPSIKALLAPGQRRALSGDGAAAAVLSPDAGSHGGSAGDGGTPRTWSGPAMQPPLNRQRQPCSALPAGALPRLGSGGEGLRAPRQPQAQAPAPAPTMWARDADLSSSRKLTVRHEFFKKASQQPSPQMPGRRIHSAPAGPPPALTLGSGLQALPSGEQLARPLRTVTSADERLQGRHRAPSRHGSTLSAAPGWPQLLQPEEPEGQDGGLEQQLAQVQQWHHRQRQLLQLQQHQQQHQQQQQQQQQQQWQLAEASPFSSASLWAASEAAGAPNAQPQHLAQGAHAVEASSTASMLGRLAQCFAAASSSTTSAGDGRLLTDVLAVLEKLRQRSDGDGDRAQWEPPSAQPVAPPFVQQQQLLAAVAAATSRRLGRSSSDASVVGQRQPSGVEGVPPPVASGAAADGDAGAVAAFLVQGQTLAQLQEWHSQHEQLLQAGSRAPPAAEALRSVQRHKLCCLQQLQAQLEAQLQQQEQPHADAGPSTVSAQLTGGGSVSAADVLGAATLQVLAGRKRLSPEPSALAAAMAAIGAAVGAVSGQPAQLSPAPPDVCGVAPDQEGAEPRPAKRPAAELGGTHGDLLAARVSSNAAVAAAALAGAADAEAAAALAHPFAAQQAAAWDAALTPGDAPEWLRSSSGTANNAAALAPAGSGSLPGAAAALAAGVAGSCGEQARDA
ncbi:hypothetical protein HT031_006608 [Scenedesmus sp. PABB004]|nr:hypothetical protein HT031_006608 [Scenedesmus sp. PABB004]